jgi:hypothetical protein
MNNKTDKDWLDKQLRRQINAAKPDFDAEQWKQKYRKQYETLISRVGSEQKEAGPRRWVLRSALAAAAAVVIAVGYGLICRPGHYGTGSSPREPAPPSPARIVTMQSLSSAFRQGGMDALNEQLDEAVEALGPRPTEASIAELFADLAG